MIGVKLEKDIEITGSLGKGAYGSVFRARQISLGRDVAVKLLDAKHVSDQVLRRFRDEARHLAALSHPNVVHVHSLGEYEGSPYILMELLEGRTLKHLLHEVQPSTLDSMRIMMDAAKGLHALHTNGIIHRDLSPNNIMVSSNGTKVFDLGLAKDLGALSTGSSEYIMGTVGYMAPEQIEGGEITAAADVFAFGAIFYELLTGQNPHKGEHHMTVLYNIVHRVPEPVGNLVPCPTDLSELIQTCLAKQANQRPSGMDQVAHALAQMVEADDVSQVHQSRSDLDQTIQIPSLSVQRNPYLNRMMIRRREDFYGRKQEVRRIFARLNANPPGCVSIVGDRKIGKSSLLNYVYSKASRQTLLSEPGAVVMVFMDLQQEEMNMDGFVRNLLQMTALELQGRIDLGSCDFTLDGVRKMVELIDSEGMKLVILLDEFERITANPDFPLEFFSFLRFLANHYNVAYLTSSARDLQSLCHDQVISDSPFFNIFSTMRLSSFTLDEAAQLISVPSAKAGYPLEPYTEEIIELAGLFPFFIQIACCHWVESLEEQEVGAEVDVREVRKRFVEEAKFHFRHMWDRFDLAERSVLRKVARGAKVQEALHHVLADLVARNYLAINGDRPQISSVAFREFAQSASREPTRFDGFWTRWKRRFFGSNVSTESKETR